MEKKKVTPTYQLKGAVGWWEDHQHDPDTFKGKMLDIEIKVSTDEEAIVKAKEQAELFLMKNRPYAPGGTRVPADETSGYWFTLTKSTDMWHMHYDSGKAEVPAKAEVIIPAEPTIPEVPPSVKEVVYE
jgi:hypothetical protein